MKRIVFLALGLIVSACLAVPAQTPTPTASIPYVLKQAENPFAPRTDDINKKQDGVVLTSVGLSERFDLDPLRAELHISGSMPSVCSELRVKINPPDTKHQVFIEVYSVADIKKKCQNVFQQFDNTVLLGVYSAGQYKVWVNDSYIGDMVSY
jgi:hypothetical protein